MGTGSTEGASVTEARGSRDAVRVCAADEIDRGEVVAANVDGTPLALVHTEDDEYFAIYDECSHAAVALSEGEVDGCTIECWLHGSRFDLRTGRPTGLPATEPVPVYPVEVREGDLYVTVHAAGETGRPGGDTVKAGGHAGTVGRGADPGNPANPSDGAGK